MRLSTFVKKHGGQEKAARVLGVTHMTIWRWLHGKNNPNSDLMINHLAKHGVDVIDQKERKIK